MFRTDHLAGPISVARYHAPSGSDAEGRTIQSGREELEFFIDGEGYYSWEDQSYTIRRGTVLWHLSGERTIYRNHPDFPYMCHVFTFPVHGVPARQVPKVTQWEDPGEAHAFAMEVLRNYHRDDIDKHKLGQTVYMRMLWHAYRYTLHQPASELPSFIQQCRHLLETQFAHPLQINSVAEEVGVSPAYLHAQFKAHLGITPYQYLLRRRLQEARHLLASSDRLVKEISFSCGFSDVVNFCRCFKARFNVSPAEYRSRNMITR